MTFHKHSSEGHVIIYTLFIGGTILCLLVQLNMWQQAEVYIGNINIRWLHHPLIYSV